jgi:uncharacterized protein (TIGR02757 family)
VTKQAALYYGPFLESVYDRYHRADYLGSDPLVMVRAFTRPDDREIAAVFASLLAYGNVKQINASLARLFAAMGNRPGRFINKLNMDSARVSLAGFKHRFADEEDVLCLCWLLHQAQKKQPLGEAFAAGIRPDESDLAMAAGRFFDYLHSFEFGPHFDRTRMLAKGSFKHLMPRADKGSACKRIHLFLRWMVRPDDGIDLGLWPQVSPSLLLVPVDTHIMRLSTNLGFSTRKSASLQFARDVTAHLRTIDPADPARFDFSLCRLGILQMCPTKADLARCGNCELHEPCQLRRRLERNSARSAVRLSLKR